MVPVQTWHFKRVWYTHRVTSEVEETSGDRTPGQQVSAALLCGRCPVLRSYDYACSQTMGPVTDLTQHFHTKN